MGRKSAKSQRERADRSQDDSSQEERTEHRDWGDEVAQARTADDPRVMAPHDRGGRPSTGRPL